MTLTDTPMVIDDSQRTRTVRKLQAALRQISEVIDYETQALESHQTPDFQEIRAKKARGLQTLSLLLDEIKPQMFYDEHREEIQIQFYQLQEKLARNQQLLQLHMEAVGELVEMINRAAHAQETDGTYDLFCLAKQQIDYEDAAQ